MPARRRRRRIHWPHLLAQIVLALFPIVYVAIDVGWVYVYRPHHFGGAGEIIGSLFDAVVILWAFAVGACLGSFLNVVALRVPRHETIGGGSYCPYCCVPIRSRDNVPILGWLGLRGRCNACRLPIPPRYMIIEIIAGAMVCALVWVQVVHGGCNLPLDGFNPQNPARLVMRWDSLLIGRTLYYALMLLYLMTTALVVGNRLLLPPLMVIAGWLLALVPALVWPHLLIYNWKSESMRTFAGQELYLAGSMTVVTGVIVGVFIARATLISLYPKADPKLLSSHADTKQAYDWIWQWAWLGAVFGWQGALGTALIWCLLLAFLYPFIRRWDFPLALPPALLFVATTVHLLLWRLLVKVPFWPGSEWGFWGAFVALIATMVLTRLLVDRDWQGVESEGARVPQSSSAVADLPSDFSQDETE